MKLRTAILFCLTILVYSSVKGQQFSSDNYLSKPHGMATIILTTGTRNTMVMNTFSLFPRWEFTAAVYVYKNDNDRLTDDGYSLSTYVKYMVYENSEKNGGFAVKAGTGLYPGFIDGNTKASDASKSYWMNAPVTLPFFKNKLSFDAMPGVSMTKDYSDTKEAAWAFTYATRLAWYPINPEIALVGEVFGSEGQVASVPEFRTGVRWEPSQYANLALTYGSKFDDTKGAGWEIGIMLFSPRFACIKGCK